jgi:hypothetical protein
MAMEDRGIAGSPQSSERYAPNYREETDAAMTEDEAQTWILEASDRSMQEKADIIRVSIQNETLGQIRLRGVVGDRGVAIMDHEIDRDAVGPRRFLLEGWMEAPGPGNWPEPSFTPDEVLMLGEVEVPAAEATGEAVYAPTNEIDGLSDEALGYETPGIVPSSWDPDDDDDPKRRRRRPF